MPTTASSRLRRPTTLLPLVVRSHYSFLNSTLSLPAILELAKRDGLPAVALCDQGNLHGAVEFVVGAQAAGLKPILGAEVRWRRQPLWLYVENQPGYANLCRLLSQDPKSIRPRDDRDRDPDRGTPGSGAATLEFDPSAFSTEGLIAVAPDPALAAHFPGRFYQAITTRGELRRYAANPGGPPAVPILPVHYARPEDRWQFDVVQSIRTLTLLRQVHPEKLVAGNFHFRSSAELHSLFGRHPELTANTWEIADRCDFAFTLGQPQFPDFQPPDGSRPHDFLRQLVFSGAAARYAAGQRADVARQLEEELGIIAAVGYEEYFLVVWDLLHACRAKGIEWITRGSAADSLVCYCLGISSVCPIRFDLYFRRFLNQERMALSKLPDIDIDFPHDRKDDVVDLLFAKYGREHCAVVGGFSTFQARSAFAEVAKVLGVAEREVRRFTEHFPWSFGGGWEPSSKHSLERPMSAGGRLVPILRAIPECSDLPLEEEPYRSALELAEFLDGVPRYSKMHPCGVVLSRQPMHTLTPTFISGKGYPTTHFDMDAVEDIGLVKMDILAQGGLAAMRDVKAMLAERGLAVDLDRFAVAPRSPVAGPQPAGDEALQGGEGRSAGFQPAVSPTSSRPGAPGRRDDPPALAPMQAGSLRHSRLEVCGTSKGRFMASEQARKEQAALPCPAFAPADAGAEGASPSAGMTEKERPVETPSPLLFPAEPPPWRFDDPAVWDLIAGGRARAVHHIESPAMISLCRMCNVRDIDTLIAIVSVIRPGAANEDKKREFTRRYQGLSPVQYPHPSLEPCLRSTFGLVVYEEHILQICEAFAGLSGGRADVLRRALVKDKLSVVATIAPEFAACARQRGRSEEKITQVWQLVTGFHGYAFCKAHSTAYGVEAYQSAWLKRHFPAEFMAAVLTNGKGFYRPLVYVLECHRLGVPLRPPWVNEPGPAFRVVSCDALDGEPTTNPTPAGSETRSSHAIRVPVTAIHSLTEPTKQRILSERSRGEFASLADFFLRVHPAAEEMETLSRAGAFDGFGQSRCAQFWEIQHLREQWQRQSTTGQQWLLTPTPTVPGQGSAFSQLAPDGRPRSVTMDLTEPSQVQRLQWETELLGFPASGHPLELYPGIAWDTYCPVTRLGEFVGQEVTLCGLVVEDRVHHQSTGEPMKFLTLADWTGLIETELFARSYRTYGLVTVRYPVLEVTARVEPFENGRGHTLRVLRAGRPRNA